MGTEINWGILGNAPDPGNAFLRGLEHGRERKRAYQKDEALKAVVANPEDEAALARLMLVDRETAIRMREYQHKEAAYKRDTQFRSALSDFAAASGPSALMPRREAGGVFAPPPTYTTPPTRDPNNVGMFDLDANQSSNPFAAPPSMSLADHSGGVSSALAPALPAPSPMPAAQPMPETGSAPQMSARDRAFMKMWEVDAVKAMDIDSKMRDQAVERLKVANQAYGFAIQNLANVQDDASYQQVRQSFMRQLEPLGIDIGANIPDRYPGPEGVRSLLMRAMDAKDQIAALDRGRRITADIDNIEADNNRADRNTDSVIQDRGARRGLIARGQNLTDARGRRGQDIASGDRRRGQDITSSDRRYATDNRPQGKAANGGKVVSVRTPEEARKLPVGTKFRTPDGKLKVR